ncbi:MAG: hypothetical protein JSU06_03370 [Actinobacteria bacterium]|nr:hypothetical protein [Actinomycetota bacterium]
MSGALVVLYADVAAGSAAPFRAWREEEQIPALRACPGVRSATWVESLEGQPQLLLLCALEDERAAGGVELGAALALGPWLRELRGWHRRTYRPIFALGEMPSPPSPFLLTVRADVTPGAEAAFNAWYDEVHVPEVLGCPGFLAATRWECTEGEPRFLALYELDRADALATPELNRVYGFGPTAPSIRSEHGRIYARGRAHG